MCRSQTYSGGKLLKTYIQFVPYLKLTKFISDYCSSFSFFIRRFTAADPINILLSASLAGSCLYIYDRKHLKSALGKQKITFR